VSEPCGQASSSEKSPTAIAPNGPPTPKPIYARLSITMDSDFCVEALHEAMDRHGRPDIFNTDQGVQFTAAAFIDTLADRGVRISMDGKGRYLDNIFIERLWRSLKYEEVFIKAYASVAEARLGIGAWLGF
jgi:putative transposase